MSLPMIQRIRGALVWESGMQIDADGAPDAYAPAHSGLVGLDALGNAGAPGNWWALACNPSGAPFIQLPGDPAPGFYVSTTALQDSKKSVRDPARYVDSTKVPYVVIPPEFLLTSYGARLSDLCAVTYKMRTAYALVADIGPHGQLGEGSIALADALGIPSSPRNGGVSDGVQWVLFPKSGAGWPVALDDLNLQAQLLFDDWGGVEALSSALANS